jgi:hypothetical protein
MENGEGTTGLLTFKAGIQLHGDYGTDKQPTSPGGNVEQVAVRTIVRGSNEN